MFTAAVASPLTTWDHFAARIRGDDIVLPVACDGRLFSRTTANIVRHS